MITVDVIKPTANAKGLSAILRGAIADAAEEAGKGIKQDYLSTTETWNHKPVFREMTRSSAEFIARKVWTTDDIYRYVHDGTAYRYAILSSDFEPKTIPGSLDSFPGRGNVIRFDYKNPLPGIIARNFTDSIIVKREGRLPIILERHLRKAVRASGFAYP